MAYSDKVLDHYNHPRNVGSLDKNDPNVGTGDDLAHSSIRFGIGRFNTEAEIDYVGDRVVETVLRLRELSPLYEMAKEGVDLKSVKWAAEAH